MRVFGEVYLVQGIAVRQQEVCTLYCEPIVSVTTANQA